MTRNHIMTAIFLLIAFVGPLYYVLQAYSKVFRGVKKAQAERDAAASIANQENDTKAEDADQPVDGAPRHPE